jgi:hypothetical protein
MNQNSTLAINLLEKKLYKQNNQGVKHLPVVKTFVVSPCCYTPPETSSITTGIHQYISFQSYHHNNLILTL